MARKRTLKVYRTPIGFHDAYVAAPSQKAALEAWGSDANLFARGVAEIVLDDALAKEPLDNPGKVIRRLRGSFEEQVAALPADRKRLKRKAASEKTIVGETGRGRAARPPTRARKPKPSRSALDGAERRLENLTREQEQEEKALADRERKLVAERRAMERAHDRARAAAEADVEAARTEHGRALDRWIADEA